MDHTPGLPSYNEFLEYRAVIVQAIAAAWHDPQFLAQLVQHPQAALHTRFDYKFPFNTDLHVQVDSSNWTPASNGGWTTNQVNVLELVLPPAPPPGQASVALAAYNARHIDFLQRTALPDGSTRG